MLHVDDDDGAVYVAGTEDPELARPLALRELADRAGYPDGGGVTEPYELAWIHSRLARVRLEYLRKLPGCSCCAGDEHEWSIWPAKPGARGAFPVVVFG
jgi:hypothetical protein